MFKQRISMIPRYNWDYKFSDLVKSSFAAFKSNLEIEQTLEKIFKQKPIFTTSGRTSLYAILKSLNLPEQSKIGVPLYCCPVVFEAIRQANLVPKFIDINLEDYSLSLSDLKKKKKSFSAVVVVHMFGHPADMDTISNICGDIPIIEDCAQSLFSKYKGQYTGFLSTASFFSFRSGKYISAGEGSAIFTNNPSLYKSLKKLIEDFNEWPKIRQILHCASTYIKSSFYKRPLYGTIGYPIGRILDRRFNLTAKSGFKLNKIAASDIKIVNDRIENFLEKVNKQRENAFYFLEKIKRSNIFLPYEKENCWSNYYQFAVRFSNTEERNSYADFLMKHGINTAKYLDDVIDTAKDFYKYKGDCPNAEYCSKKVLIIPNYYTLSQADLDHIVNCFNDGPNN